MARNIRLLSPSDEKALARLQRGSQQGRPSSLFDTRSRLPYRLDRADRVWTGVESDGELEAAVCVGVEPENRLGKVQWMFCRDPRCRPQLRYALAHAMTQAQSRCALDMVFSTTRNYSLEEQAVAVELGFSVLGVFPNAPSADPTRLNGLAVWLAEGVLEHRRRPQPLVHSELLPLLSIVSGQCGLPLPSAGQTPTLPAFTEEVPELELIEAPRFVAERYHQLSTRKKLSVNFYPFQVPNALFTTPDRSIEVFVNIDASLRVAAVLAEHLMLPVSPVRLHQHLAETLLSRGVHYIEIINDAADALSIECILRAGYAPAGYLPCLKSTGDKRRDYVVFARTAEAPRARPEAAPARYRDYLVEFCRLRQRYGGGDRDVRAAG